MSATELRPSERQRPLVAVVCAVPLLGEAMTSALDFAEVRAFAAGGGDVAGLLEWLRPDAVVVDDRAAADAAALHAAGRSLPLVHVTVRERTLRIFRDDEWHEVEGADGSTPEAIRNVVAGALFARGRSR